MQEEFRLHTKPIAAMCYSPELDCLITASEDSTTRVHYLGRQASLVLIPAYLSGTLSF